MFFIIKLLFFIVWKELMIKIGTQTERTPAQFINIDSYHKMQFDIYYFDTATESTFTLRNGKNGKIRKQIKPTYTNNRFIVLLRDINDNPKTLNYTTLIEFLKSEYL